MGLAVLLAGCSGIDTDAPGEDPVKVGDPVPAFSVTMQDGNNFNSRELGGMPAMIVFFHTSCADCQRTLPLVQQVYERYGPAGVRFVCIARAQGAAEIQTFWQQYRLTLPWSAQEDRSVYSCLPPPAFRGFMWWTGAELCVLFIMIIPALAITIWRPAWMRFYSGRINAYLVHNMQEFKNNIHFFTELLGSLFKIVYI